MRSVALMGCLGALTMGLTTGMVLKPAVKYQDIAHGPRSVPRDNH